MTSLELLSPAKDAEHGIAAVNHGADAVYIGAPMFSARKAAGTTPGEIERMVRYAHLYRAKVYVAMNTILYDHELETASKLIREIYNTGADALIIQDMGILEMDLPPIPLHASTQTHNATPEKVLFLEKAGFKRVVLARELTSDEISAIRKNTTIELEAFIHGALCVSYSGQCYMSQSVCGRSGNRGECAQPCRSAYHLTNAQGKVLVKNKHLLSLRDLNLTSEIPALVQSGITSFKIEGRLKDMSYVKNTVSHYRAVIDSFLNGNENYRKASSGFASPGFIPDPGKTFNRGYTTYHFRGRNEKLSTFHTQKATGMRVGEITAMNGGKISYKGTELHPGDGICFFTKENELKGFHVNRFESGCLVPSNTDGLYTGAVLYRNFDIQFENQLKQPVQRKISVEMKISGNIDHISLQIKDEDGNITTASRKTEGIKAENSSLILQQIEKQMNKLGNTAYQLTKLSMELPVVPFLPVSQINELRREAVELLEKERLLAYIRKESQIEPNNFPFPRKEVNYRANISNRLSAKFYERHGAKVTEMAFEIHPDVKEKILMETKHCIRYQLDACLLTPGGKTLPEPLFLKDQQVVYQLKFNCKECVMLVVKKE